jgi:uncharacterized protein
MSDKLFVSPESLRLDSLRLAKQIMDSGWAPTHMVALWRGGASIGLVIHEAFKYQGNEVDHIAVRTSRYTAPGHSDSEVRVHAMDYLVWCLNANSRVLIVDDVYESGLSIAAVIGALADKLAPVRRLPSDIRVATLYYKGTTKNKTQRAPDYYVHTTPDKWLVFPHELEELTPEEIEKRWGSEATELLGLNSTPFSIKADVD